MALEWQPGVVMRIVAETPRTKTLTLWLPKWVPHQAGQHYDVRLTGPDGYQTERSYSVASEPERAGEIDLTVECIEDGEVSPYLHDVVEMGDRLEVRGPIGGYFVWDVSLSGSLLLIAGGSGVVPFRAMLRHRAVRKCSVPTRLLYSIRSSDEVIYRGELETLARAGDGLDVIFTFTRNAPENWTGYRRRIDQTMIDDIKEPLGNDVRAYVCGPTPLVEMVSDALVTAGVAAEAIRTERFGPTGA
jgi:ferredoxin-NADP reductase